MTVAIMTRRSNAAIGAAVLLAFSSILSGAAIAAATSTVQADVEVFVCSTDRQDAPVLSMYPAGSGVLKKLPLAPDWSFSDHAWRTSLDVPAGSYVVSARSKQCAGQFANWYAQPGAVRHVAFTLNQPSSIANIDGDRNAGVVYGSLPSQTAQVELLPADAALREQTRRQVSIDGTSYQVTNLARGRYTLRVLFGSVIVRREIMLPSSHAIVRADFTAADAAEIVRQQANGSAFVQVSGGAGTASRALRLGNATIDGWTSDAGNPAQ
jgi:hypothetical protein